MKRKVLTAGVLALVATPAVANTALNYPIGRPTYECVVEIALQQKVPVDVMLGVNSVERGETRQFVRNTNGTYDMGAFQINTIHLPMVASKFGAGKQDLAARGCFNALVASTLLKGAIEHPKKQHLDFYARASGYHSWTPKYNTIYRQKLVKYTKEWQRWLVQTGQAHYVQSPRLI